MFHGSAPISTLAPSAATEHAISSNPKYGVVLRMASRVMKDDSTAANEPPKDMLLIDDKELVALKYVLPKRATRGFQTDTEISAGANVNTDRQLTAFVHEDTNTSPQLAFSLNERSHESGSWNQFEANQGMVNTSVPQYREDMYTTPLDRTSAHYRAKIAEATRIAQEIESGVTENTHIAEERGQVDLHDDTMDEEDRYSMVLGGTPAPTGAPAPARAKGSYVPPALRDQQATDAPPGLAKGSNNKSQQPAQRSSSPRLSGLNLASDANANANNNKAFTPYSSDPSKNPTPNPATRTEDTAKLRQSGSDLDEKVKRSASDDAATVKKDMRAFMSASAWVAPTQRKGQEILEGMGLGSGSSSPATTATTSPVPTPVPAAIAPFPAMNHPMNAGSPPVLQGHALQQMMQQQQLAQQHAAHLHQQQQQQHHQHQQQQQQKEAPAPGSFASLLRNDVLPRTPTEIYREVLRDIVFIESKSEWERKQGFPFGYTPYGAATAGYGFHPQTGAPIMMHPGGHFVAAPVNFVQPQFAQQPHQ